MPEPVSAVAMREQPLAMMGQACCCTGSGRSSNLASWRLTRTWSAMAGTSSHDAAGAPGEGVTNVKNCYTCCVQPHTLPILRNFNGRLEEKLAGGAGSADNEVKAAVWAGGVRFEPLLDARLVEGLPAHAQQPYGLAAHQLALLAHGTRHLAHVVARCVTCSVPAAKYYNFSLQEVHDAHHLCMSLLRSSSAEAVGAVPAAATAAVPPFISAFWMILLTCFSFTQSPQPLMAANAQWGKDCG